MALDRISTTADAFIDARGRRITLRGFVVQTADFAGDVAMDEADYDLMASWGVNAQVLRLGGGKLGVLDGELDPTYVDELDRRVTLAAERGIWSMFKMTTYDVPAMVGPGGDPHGPEDPGRLIKAAFGRQFWQRFWDDDDWRADRIRAWRLVWQRFRGRSEVIGYDLLNEPARGTADAARLVEDHLFPFYRACVRALREIDPDAIAIVQPAVGLISSWGPPPEGLTPHGPQPSLGDSLCAFAPHYYLDMTREVPEPEYEQHLRHLLEEAREVGGPLLIGEYGQRNVEVRLDPPLPTFRKWNRADAERKAHSFDELSISTIRPWYNDPGYLAVLDPGRADSERLDVLVRAFVERVPGRASWHHDIASRSLAATVEVHESAPTVVMAPRWLYPDGAVVAVGGSLAAKGSGRIELEIPAGRHTLTAHPS